MTDHRSITVVGAGAMGTAIAVLCAAHGYRVALTDADNEKLATFPTRATPIVQYLSGSSSGADDILSKVERYSSLAESVKGSFLIQETIHEDLRAKQELFRQLDNLCDPSVILATNTSSFLLSELCEQMEGRQRMVGIHYVAPAHIVRAVEVLTAPFTKADIVTQAQAFVSSIDHVSITTRESPGFIINRIQYALKAEVVKIVEQGLASVEDVDAAVRLAIGPRLALWGPLMQEDMSASKKTVVSVGEYIHNATGNEHFKPAELLKKLVAAGNTGAVSGAGWYEWNISPEQLTLERDRQLADLITWLRANDRRDALGAKGENPLIGKARSLSSESSI